MKIIDFELYDIRFPTSDDFSGSDAMNPDPDYSAAYLIIKTDQIYQGHGLCFTIGRGNDLCKAAIALLKPHVVGKSLASITSNMGQFWHQLNSDSQLRWLGPEKGIIHMALGTVINALWDLWAKAENKPLWQLICEMTPQEIVKCIDFRYIEDAITPDEALVILNQQLPTRQQRLQAMQNQGYPAYTTTAGWLGYSDDKIKYLAEQAVASGFRHLKMKVGADLAADKRRLQLIRDTVGSEVKMMIDANQVWEVEQAIDAIKQLADYDLWWVEEPTNPDDILGHQRIRQAVTPIRIATGEHCHNRIMFKQFMQAAAFDVCQIDSCRLAGVNEVLAVMLMAAKFNIPVCPHAGGVGLCEYVQHLALIDYIAISGDLNQRVLEYVDHLHQHFIDPVVIKNGCYQVPQAAGYSITMKPQTLKDYCYPHGKVWQQREALC